MSIHLHLMRKRITLCAYPGMVRIQFRINRELRFRKSSGAYLTIAVPSIILKFALIHPALALRVEVERGVKMFSFSETKTEFNFSSK
jgi:hypothetical protein